MVEDLKGEREAKRQTNSIYANKIDLANLNCGYTDPYIFFFMFLLTHIYMGSVLSLYKMIRRNEL